MRPAPVLLHAASALNNERRPPCPSAPCPSSPSTAPNFSTMSVGCCEGPGGASEEGAGEGDTGYTTRGDPTEKPTENATGKVHVRTREQGGGRRAARSTKPRARAPACSLHYLVVGSPWRCPPCRLPLLRWRRLVPRQTKSAAHSTKRRLLLFLPPSYSTSSFSSPGREPRLFLRFRRRWSLCAVRH